MTTIPPKDLRFRFRFLHRRRSRRLSGHILTLIHRLRQPLHRAPTLETKEQAFIDEHDVIGHIVAGSDEIKLRIDSADGEQYKYLNMSF